jgi:hypothetical protein
MKYCIDYHRIKTVRGKKGEREKRRGVGRWPMARDHIHASG